MEHEIRINDKDGASKLVIDNNVVKGWMATYKKYSPMLLPNRKTVAELIEYITMNYPVEEDKSEKSKSVVVNNITMNEFLTKRIPDGKNLNPIVFLVKNEGSAKDCIKSKMIFTRMFL